MYSLHYPLLTIPVSLFSLGISSPPSRERVPSRQYHLANWDSINSSISSHDWTHALACLDAENAFSYFSNFSNSLLETFVPKTTRSQVF